MFQSFAARTLLALIIGLVAGAAFRAAGLADGSGLVAAADAVGGLWLNALQMTVIPLIFALIVTGAASASSSVATGGLVFRTLIVFGVLLLGAAVYGVLASRGLLAVWSIDPAAAEALRGGATDAAVNAAPPGFGDWLRSLAPSNVVTAAANGAILQIVVFALLFGFAVAQLPADLRQPAGQVFKAIQEAMIVVVRWVLKFAPLGVFALSFAVATQAGLGVAGVLLQYVVIMAAAISGITVFSYVLIGVLRPVGLAQFARAAAPAQVVAFSTQSSIASLPAMIERSRGVLGVSEKVAGLLLPLAVAVFRLTSPVGNLTTAFFVAAVYGVEPSLAQMVSAVAVAVMIAVGTIGLPGQISFFASVAPICLTLGVPLDLLGILLAVDVIPDIFRTVGNVTADMAVTSLMARTDASQARP